MGSTLHPTPNGPENYQAAGILPESLNLPPVETWENQYRVRPYRIDIAIPEFTSVCPKTGLPDFGTIRVDYVPDAKVIELKAFKYYLLAYRNVGMFYENIINTIATDIIDAIDPYYLRVHGQFTPRGGIGTQALVVHTQPGWDTTPLTELYR